MVLSVDVSGSMSSPAVIKGQMDEGLTLLDLVKHAIKTIIHNLDKNDTMSLITYSSKAELRAMNIKMTKLGKTTMLKHVEQM